MNRSAARSLLALVLAAGAALVAPMGAAQERTIAPYRPLFTDEMIRNAAPEQRARMRAAEENNRATYDRRQQQAEAPPGAVSPPAAAASAPPPRSSRSKVYRWVDDKGRVHFGDAPAAARGAEEVRIRSTTGVAPRAAPGSSGSVPDRPASPARGDSRQQRRGS